MFCDLCLPTFSARFAQKGVKRSLIGFGSLTRHSTFSSSSLIKDKMWVKVPPTIKPLSIRLLQQGCGNRPFFHIVVAPTDDRCISHGVEQLGVFDPMPNERGERLLALNVDRFKYYMAGGAWLRSSLAMLLGCAGVVPIHPHAYTLAWKARQRQLEKEKNEEKEASAASAS